jgi:hypothetical protein
MWARCCMRCGKTIEQCMGFVHAGDWLLAMRGVIPWWLVRERCGLCAEREFGEN